MQRLAFLSYQQVSSVAVPRHGLARGSCGLVTQLCVCAHVCFSHLKMLPCPPQPCWVRSRSPQSRRGELGVARGGPHAVDQRDCL